MSSVRVHCRPVRVRLVFLVLLVSASVAPAASAAPVPAGGLNGVGCVSNPTDAASFGCTAGHASLLGLFDGQLSSDERQLYVAGSEDLSGGRVVNLARDPATGALSFSECFAPTVPGCSSAAPLSQTSALSLSPDGTDLYVSDYSVGILHFRRAAGGQLTYVGCYAPTATVACPIAAPGTGGASDIQVSQDGKNVYVAGYSNDAVAVLSRNTTTGALTWLECHTTAATPMCSPLAGNPSGLDQATGVALSSDRVHVSARFGDGFTTFARNPADGRLSASQFIVSSDFLNGAQTLIAAPDGSRVYVGLFDGTGLTTLGIGATGTPSLVGCLRRTASAACPASAGVNAVFGLGFSPDGGILYAAARNGGTLASFRVGAGGALTLASCAHAPSEAAEGCDHAVNGLASVQAAVASGDGRFVYGVGAAVTTLTPEHAPTCAPLSQAVANGRGTELQLRCSDSDGQPLAYSIASQPAHGRLTLIDSATGRVRYQPAAGYAGADSFGFTASDGTNASAAAQATLTVPADTRKPRPRILARRVRLTRSGQAKIRLRCMTGEPGGCVGTLSARTLKKFAVASTRGARKRVVKLGSRRISIAEGRTRTVTLKVPRKGRRLVATRRRLTALLIVQARDPSGNRGRSQRRVLVLAPRR
jgi:Bacterial Ig domain/Lactonase, 7-bladed beta-propeller